VAWAPLKALLMKIKRATLEQLNELARMFDLYRQFYMQEADLDKARHYLNRV
jgi:hypothetical protein